ncbi:hypothetical protein Scep_019430 [Stephania cephalantha]|uniref:Uncharacterized protein n=1 Tax=Stephania cephalantha TaxID=152367 RepID=A0AAP0NPT8_9MAGN
MDYSYTVIKHRKIRLEICAFWAIFHSCSPRVTPSFVGFQLQYTCRLLTGLPTAIACISSTPRATFSFARSRLQLTRMPAKLHPFHQSSSDKCQKAVSQQRHHESPHPIVSRHVTAAVCSTNRTLTCGRGLEAKY